MKRIGNLWPSICERSNLQDAFYKAAKGKRDRGEVGEFVAGLEGNLAAVRRQLRDGSYRLGDHRRFTVHDPKEREIHAAPFSQRVIHHAVMNVCEPHIERRLIHHSYACRKGKGQYAALDAALKNARRYPFYLKLDIRKYFDSIPHERAIEQLGRIFKDRPLMEFWIRFLDSYETTPGRRLPIGSLSSQHLANLYLSPLDRWAQAQEACRGYVRYMDDFVVWGCEVAGLRRLQAELEKLLAEDLGLQLKHPGSIQKSSRGMDFLGYRVALGGLRLNRRSWTRFRRKCIAYLPKLESGQWDQAKLAGHLIPLSAFVSKAGGSEARVAFLQQFGEAAIGLEPR